MKLKEIEKFLRENGWKLKGIRCSHYQYVNNCKRGEVTKPNRSGDITKGTVKSIMKQTRITKVIP